MSDNGAATGERRPQSGRKNVGVARSKEPIEVINDHFWRNSKQGEYTIIPHINDEVEFRRFIKLTFGSPFEKNISMKGIEKMRQDILSGKFKGPKYEFKELKEGEYGYYREDNQTITLNRKKVQLATKDPVECWTLLLVMIEEFGHHLDYSIRYIYSNIKGDTKGDEGKAFANLYLLYNELWKKGSYFADIKFAMRDEEELNDAEEIKFNLEEGAPSKSERAAVLEKTNSRGKEIGYIISEAGEEVKAEYFAIRGKGAVHEDITKDAAKEAQVIYDDALDEGCAWPDVPCENQERIETSYTVFILRVHYGVLKNKKLLAYKSHYGEYSFWHSMFPPGKKVGEIKELIIAQAREWYSQGIENKGEKVEHGPNKSKDYGLFFVGKLLHMLQDSFTKSHTIREKEENHIIGKDDTPEMICKKYSVKWGDLLKHSSNMKLRSSFIEYIKQENTEDDEYKAAKKLFSQGEYYTGKQLLSKNIGSVLYIPNRIILFQDYNMQDAVKHGTADKVSWTDQTYKDAKAASVKILTFYKDKKKFTEGVEGYLRNEVYVLSTKCSDINLGVTHKDYANDKAGSENIYPFKD